MSAVCPNGHDSTATDFCDTCGAKIDAAAVGGGSAPAPAPTPAPAPEALTCPHCQAANPAGSLFCEACGYDFTTGVPPRGSAPAQEAATGAAPAPEASPQPHGLSLDTPEEQQEGHEQEAGEKPAPAPTQEPLAWVAEVWIDPDWYAGQEAEDPMPSAGLPTVVPLRSRSALVGRVSASRGITPDVDCTADTGVSRRHAQLTSDGTRWFVEDLGSSNGTYVGNAAGPLPENPIAVGPKTELDSDDRVYVGAWTRIVVRRATDEEIEAASGSTA